VYTAVRNYRVKSRRFHLQIARQPGRFAGTGFRPDTLRINCTTPGKNFIIDVSFTINFFTALSLHDLIPETVDSGTQPGVQRYVPEGHALRRDSRGFKRNLAACLARSPISPQGEEFARNMLSHHKPVIRNLFTKEG
jgi:hypothetical protein